MNVTNLSAGRWRLESESTPGKYYEVQYNSDAARKQGVPYSCDCQSWINNQYNRTCKHIKEIESLVQNNVMKLGIKTAQVSNYPNMGTARKRGRPLLEETARCTTCHKRTIRMKEEGICGNNNCPSFTFSKRARNRRGKYKYGPKEEVKTTRSIDDDTVEVSNDALKEIANRLEL